MARLPQPGGDSGNWGNILNDFLSQTLDHDGTIKNNAVTGNAIAPNAITAAKIASNAIGTAAIADGSITETLLDSNVIAKLNATGASPAWTDITNKPAVIAAGATQSDARTAIGAGTSSLVIGTTSTTAKAGDYHPAAANITDATATGRALLTAVNPAAAKTVLTFSKADVGLGNVDNTSDTSKPVSTAQQTALDTKVDKVSMANRVLATDGSGGQAHYSWTVGASADSFVRRTSDGQVRTATPTDSADATNKSYVDTAVAGLVAPTSSQSLSNKTLVNPRLSGSVLDANGNPLIMSNSWAASATNYLGVESSSLNDQYVQLNALGDDTDVNLSLKPKGNGAVSIFAGLNDTAVLGANGTAANVNLNLTTKGNGAVRINGTDAVSTTGNQTLANKTISGSSNTLTNIPPSAINGLSTDYSKLVCTTAAGATGAENGTNTWAKIATFSAGTTEFAEGQVVLSISGGNSGNHDTAIISVYFRTNASNSNPTVDVRILSKGGEGFSIASDSFKVISDGWSSDMELWFRKAAPYGRFAFYEVSKRLDGGTLTYGVDPAWQSAPPIGSVNNVSSNGIFSGLSLKVKGSVSLSDGIKDANGNPSLDLGSIPNAVNRIYIDNQSSGNYPTIGATGPDANIGLALAPKNDGPVNLFGNAPTIAAAGGANGGNLNLNLKSQGTGVVQANGKPVMTSWMKYPFYSDPGRYEPWPQMLNFGGNWTLVSGDVPLTFFIPTANMTVSNIITMGWNDTTQTNATVCKVAIYRVDDVFSSGNKMQCIARSAHKADRWNGSVLDTAPIVDDGATSPSPISSITLTAGQEYAVGFISVGHTGSPKLSALGTFRKNTLLPHLGFFGGGGHTDMPTHISSGWLEEWTYIWFALS